jgi:predicted nucleic acid-binding protein
VILVDTSVWIDYFNGHDSVEAVHLRSCIVDGRPLVIPGLVLTEILQGVRTEAEAARIVRALSAFDAPPELDSTDYQKAAALYRQCRSRGFTIRSTIDCLIAQLCLRHDYELLAKDRDFVSIAEVAPLQRVPATAVVHDRPRGKASNG